MVGISFWNANRKGDNNTTTNASGTRQSFLVLVVVGSRGGKGEQESTRFDLAERCVWSVAVRIGVGMRATTYYFELAIDQSIADIMSHAKLARGGRDAGGCDGMVPMRTMLLGSM